MHYTVHNQTTFDISVLFLCYYLAVKVMLANFRHSISVEACSMLRLYINLYSPTSGSKDKHTSLPT